MKRTQAIFLLKLAFTVAVLAYLFAELVEMRELASVLRRMELGAVAMALGLYLAGYLLRARRWQLVLGLLDVPVRYVQLLPIFLIGAFVGTFTPGTLGVDATRAVWVRRLQAAPYGLTIGSILLERLAGLLALLTIFAAVAALYSFQVYGLQFAWLGLGLLGLLAVGAAILFIFHRRGWLTRLLARLPGKKLGEEVGLLMDAASRMHWQPGALAATLALSFGHQFSLIGVNWVLARGLQVPVSFGHLCLFVPAIVLVSSLPATINGIGLREAAYLALFRTVGISAAQSVSLSLVYFLVATLAGALGGLVFVLYRQPARGAEAERG